MHVTPYILQRLQRLKRLSVELCNICRVQHQTPGTYRLLAPLKLARECSMALTSARASERPVSAHAGAMTSADLPAPLESAASTSSLRPLITRTPR